MKSKLTLLSKQLMFFILVGGSAALTHFLCLLYFVEVQQIKTSVANVLAFLIAFIVSFSGHFLVTFRNSGLSVATFWKSLPRWLITSILAFLPNQGLFVAGLRFYGEQYYIVIWLIVTAIITVCTFIIGKYWAFAIHDKKRSH